MVKSKKVIVGTGNEGGLIAFIRSLFRAKCDASAFEEMQRKPKHKAAEAETGIEAAAKYRLRHPRMGINQLRRYHAIEVGLRPLRYDVLGKRERKVMEKHG